MKNDKEVITFEELYRELRLYILSFLDPRKLGEVARVSKQWKLDSEERALWKAQMKTILGKENPGFSKDLYKKIHMGSFELLEIMKNKKLKQAIEQAQELQKECQLEFIIKYLFNENVFPQEQISQHWVILKNGFSLVKETDELFDRQRIEHYTILHLLAACGEVQAIKNLCEVGFDINVRGPLWLTPLHVAVLYNQFDVIEVLIALGANKAIRSKAWLFEKFPRVSPMELAAFMGRYKMLAILYIEKVKMGPDNSELVEDIKDSYGWGGRCFLECLIGHFEIEIKAEFEKADKKDLPQSLMDIYVAKKNLLDEFQGDATSVKEQLENILGSANYGKMKTLDFFIECDWAAPEWFVKMHKELQIDESSEEPPRKIHKSR